MPAYPGNNLATLLYENRQGIFWNDEAVVSGTMSVAFELRRERGAYYPWGFAVQVSFDGAPGTIAIDVMGAETDDAANYVKLGTISAVNSSNVGRFDTVTFWPKFVALVATTVTNAVNMTALVTR
jgi:hypothetical protein